MSKCKCKRKRYKTKLFLFIAFLIICSAFAYRTSSQILLDLAESDFVTSVSSCAYEALGNELLNSTTFSEFYEITYNNDGDITFISTDSFKINMLAYQLSVETHKNYSAYCEKGVLIPLGAFTGIKFLSGLGNKISVKLINVHSVKCIFVSSLESAGINQTRQTLYLKITANVTIVTPGEKIDREASILILAYDNLIVGKVPSIYLTTKTIGE